MRAVFSAGMILGLMLVSLACNEGPLQKYVGEIDSLILEVEQAEKELEVINPRRYKSWRDTIDFDVRFIHATYPDTMPLENAVKVETYYRTRKSINKYESTWKDQKSDVQFSLKQLRALRMDVESGALDTLGFMEYYGSEKAAIERLMESNVSLRAWAKNIEKNYTKLRPEIQVLMEKGKAVEE